MSAYLFTCTYAQQLKPIIHLGSLKSCSLQIGEAPISSSLQMTFVHHAFVPSVSWRGFGFQSESHCGCLRNARIGKVPGVLEKSTASNHMLVTVKSHNQWLVDHGWCMFDKHSGCTNRYQQHRSFNICFNMIAKQVSISHVGCRGLPGILLCVCMIICILSLSIDLHIR